MSDLGSDLWIPSHQPSGIANVWQGLLHTHVPVEPAREEQVPGTTPPTRGLDTPYQSRMERSKRCRNVYGGKHTPMSKCAWMRWTSGSGTESVNQSGCAGWRRGVAPFFESTPNARCKARNICSPKARGLVVMGPWMHPLLKALAKACSPRSHLYYAAKSHVKGTSG